MEDLSSEQSRTFDYVQKMAGDHKKSKMEEPSKTTKSRGFKTSGFKPLELPKGTSPVKAVLFKAQS